MKTRFCYGFGGFPPLREINRPCMVSAIGTSEQIIMLILLNFSYLTEFRKLILSIRKKNNLKIIIFGVGTGNGACTEPEVVIHSFHR